MPKPLPPIAELLADQRQRWAKGDAVEVEAYLQRYPSLGDNADAFLDLIYQEVYLREGQGQKSDRTDYLQRFPHLAGLINDQFDVHDAIAAAPVEPDLPSIPGYQITEEIGRGGMSQVYKAKNANGEWVALKILRREQLAEPSIRQRFLAEARTMMTLRHPSIVKVLEVGEPAGAPYFAMELIEGYSLETMVRTRSASFGQCVEWLIVAAEAIDYVHGKGILHRDLKPANLMVDAAGKLRVMDFGMAKIPQPTGEFTPILTPVDTILGTPSYMPPEQAGEGGIAPGPYSDIYSLGAILYALLTGQPPFDEGNLLRTLIKVRSPEPPIPVRQIRPDAPEPLERICQHCLNKRPADRLQSARELADILRLYLRHAHKAIEIASTGATLRLKSVLIGEWIAIVEEPTTIGRAISCDVVLPTPDVSRCHYRIFHEAGQHYIEDMGSTRGTQVNGVAVNRKPLKGGDQLKIAQHLFEVELHDPPRLPPIY